MTETNPESVAPEEEPKLKYHRMMNDVSKILQIDSISCINVHPKFVCIGTEWGSVYLLDHEGYLVTIGTQSQVYKSDSSSPKSESVSVKEKALQFHTVAVNQISVDINGDYIATCSDDGKVNVYGLYATENNHKMSLGNAIKSIALDPNYYKSGSGQRFLIGDTKFTLYEKGFLNRIKSGTIFECQGYVQAMAWQDRFVAWASDLGVRVYDLVARCSLGLIKWERNKSVSIEDYRCNLVWSAENTLMIGWVDTIRICVIRKRTSLQLQTRAASEYFVDPVHTFQTDYYICGLGPLDNQLIILGFPKEVDPITGKAQRPSLNIIDYKDCEFTEISSDSLNINGHEEHSCNQYHLASVIEENRFFIVSPKDIIIAIKNDIDDRVQWLVDHDYFKRAMNVLEKASGKSSKHTLSSVRILHMDRSLDSCDFEEAAKLCSIVCSADMSLWEEQIHKFANANCLRSISQYLPKMLDKKHPKIYEMVLQEYLNYDAKGFLKLVKEWNPELYTIKSAIDAVLTHIILTVVDKSIYLEALAVLYCHQKTYEKALSMYLKLRHQDVFELIKKQDLYDFIHNKILDLMNLDETKTIALLMDRSKIPMEVVEEQFKSNDYYMYKYLDALSKVDFSGKYHGRLVKLYVEYARDKLLPFLKSSDNYPIQEALDICKKKEFHHETVYLLGRIGSTKEALNIIIEKLADINQAISFCQEHDDKELWMDLVNHSLDKPEYISLLLKRIGNYVDPRVVILGIKPGCEIVDLKDSLGKMMGDYNLQLSVQDACKAITLRNYFDLHEKLVKGQQQGVCISDDCLCSSCGGRIIIKDLSHARDLKAYNCRHFFHIGCLSDKIKDYDICGICNPLKL